jgi:hypothetical protein
MNELRRAMPLLAASEGVWEGQARYFDADGQPIDAHRVRLVCRLPADGPIAYHQTNHYTWDNGRKEIREFPAVFRDGRVWFDTDRIHGWLAEVALDERRRTLMLHALRRDESDTYLYEMIQTSDCGRYRSRVWQWLRHGRTWMRTLVDEQKVADRPDGA